MGTGFQCFGIWNFKQKWWQIQWWHFAVRGTSCTPEVCFDSAPMVKFDRVGGKDGADRTRCFNSTEWIAVLWMDLKIALHCVHNVNHHFVVFSLQTGSLVCVIKWQVTSESTWSHPTIQLICASGNEKPATAGNMDWRPKFSEFSPNKSGPWVVSTTNRSKRWKSEAT